MMQESTTTPVVASQAERFGNHLVRPFIHSAGAILATFQLEASPP